MEGVESNEIYLYIAAAIFCILSLAMGLIILHFIATKRYHQQEIQSNKKIFFSILETQERERSKIAKDLHDSIGSNLNIIFLYLQQLDTYATSDEVKDILKSLHDMVNKSITTARTIAHDLLPPTLEEFGFVEALKEMCMSYDALDKLNVNLQVEATKNKSYDKIIESNLFRICQELITNSIKHGKSKNIDIKISGPEDKIELDYIDDGKGFDLEQVRIGIGMNSIKRRIELLEGSFQYNSQLGSGFRALIGVSTNSKLSENFQYE